MAKELTKAQEIERTIQTTYRKKIWSPFVRAIKDFEMIAPNDKIAVCISGGKDSMLMAKLFQMLKRITNIPFEVVYLVMNPGYNDRNLQRIVDNANLLGIPITVFNTRIFDATVNIEKNPCYICARMRRGYLYQQAQEFGCNKIALGHHFNDVIETTLMSMLNGGQIQGMLPRLYSTNYNGMELIRPLYYVHEDSIINWKNRNGLEFIACACKMTENINEYGEQTDSARQRVKNLIKELKKTNEFVEDNIFMSMNNVQLDTVLGYKIKDKRYSFMQRFDKEKNKDAN
ncbi:MAG: tRNA 2-thiocytidine biosynthesis protein TtcA [Clostridia bacterium]|nr:tRNA 2-thiocytidine biosynthesis protein TtcA [Clostridia bacterium]